MRNEKCDGELKAEKETRMCPEPQALLLADSRSAQRPLQRKDWGREGAVLKVSEALCFLYHWLPTHLDLFTFKRAGIFLLLLRHNQPENGKDL